MGFKRVLYHYTTKDCFFRIIKSSNIWATRSITSNDSKDSIYIFDILNEVLDEYKYHKLEREYKFIQIVKNIFFTLEKENNQNNKQNIETLDKAFCLSFANKKDSRFYWEAYTKNEGFNFVFDRVKLINYFNHMQNMNHKKYFDRFLYGNVIYDKSMQKKKIREIINDAINKENYYIDNVNTNQLNFFNLEGINNNITNLIMEIVINYHYISPFIKHPFWREEKEYRFVFYRKYKDNNLLKININNNPKYDEIYCQPYISIPFININSNNKMYKNFFESIIISPESIFTKIYIIELLKDYEYKNLNVYESIGKDIIRNTKR